MNDKTLRKHVLSLLSGRNAHIGFEGFIKDFPVDACGRKIEGLPYTAWQVLEHMRIAQWDILEFSRDPAHVSPEFPEGYWPGRDEPGNADLWKNTVERFHADLKQMEEIVADRSVDLLAKIPHGKGQTILREALLIADHNAYHLGALLVMSRMLTTSPTH
jgi:hypothetical protein